jgi:uncharacterized protein YbjT (DUF2867 family)
VIVVAGGSGTLGRRVVSTLVERGETVRVLVRHVDRARELLGPEVEVVAGDVRDRDAVAQASAGASCVVSAMHGLLGGARSGPDEVDRQGNAHLADAARRVGATLVMLSVVGASASSPLELSRAKHAAEQELTGSSWVVVRAGVFFETWVDVLRSSAARLGRPLVLGKGERPMPFVSVVDVAAVVARAATDATLHGQVLEVGGQMMTMNELAAAVQRRDGRTGGPLHLPRTALRTSSVLADPLLPPVARMSRAALAFDTSDLPPGDTGLRARLGLPPATTVDDVLSSGLARQPPGGSGARAAGHVEHLAGDEPGSG